MDTVTRLRRLQHDRAHQQRVTEELRQRVRDYETQYGMTAQEAHAAIDNGTLKETHDVCDWLMAASLLADIGG